MGIFKKHKNNEAFKIQLEREAMDKINHPEADELTLPLELDGDNSVWKISGKTKSPHTITAEELNGGSVTLNPASHSSSGIKPQDIPMTREENNMSSSDFLYNRMIKSRQQETAKTVLTPPAPTENPIIKEETAEPISTQNEAAVTKQENSTPVDIDAMIKSLKDSVNSGEAVTQPNANEDVADTIDTFAPENSDNSTSDASENKDASPSPAPAPSPKQILSAEERRTSLLARCNAYLEDDEFGAYKIDTEKYKLESVESILEDFENRASQRINRRFNTGKVTSLPQVTPSAPISEIKTMADLTKTVILPEITPNNTEEDDNADSSATQVITLNINDEAKDTAKHYFVADTVNKKENTVETSERDIFSTRVVPDLEDISSKSLPANLSKTGVFNPIDNAIAGTHVNAEKHQIPSEGSYETNDTDVLPDYNSIADREKVLEGLMASKNHLTLRSFITLVILVPSILLLTPLANSIASSGGMVIYIIDLVLCIMAIFSNLNVIRSILSLFTGDNDPDLPAAVATVGTTLFSIINIALGETAMCFSSVILLTLLFHNISKHIFYSRAIKNFELIANSEVKHAVSIVKNKNVTKAMVGNAIDGGSLICCGVETTNIRNFLKYTYCSNPVAGKVKSIAIIGMFLALGFGIAGAILSSGDFVLAFKYFAATLCITASPATLFLVTLPLKSADTRLRLYDSMLTGYRAADELDLCNGIAVNCLDLFPEGSIRLVDMKILSPNPFDQSILDAAALAEAIGSPISGIFKQVNITSSYKTEKPNVDSMVYEEKMGISGWVNDRRVFIGNRVLMEAHGFNSLPPVELDKKIMRKGYFPVYLASDNIPCALFVVKYSADEDLAYELRRLCNTGTTVLIHNCDPNISDQMICDYFGVHDDTVSVMSKHGSNQYKILTAHKEERSAGAVYKKSVCGFFAIMTAAINIKKSISAMTAIYILCSILGFLALGVSIFASLAGYITPISLLIFNCFTSLIIFLPPFLRRP